MPEISTRDFDAVLFDMDGVVTRTADVHAAAWKETFDRLLRERAEASEAPFEPFDLDRDYKLHVDGKPRLDGIRDFLAARSIDLPEGSEEDDSGTDTIHALARRKNDEFHRLLERDGVRAFESTVELIRNLREREVHTAIISSSKNCEAVTKAAGVDHLFDTRVAGVESAERGLAGKPAPDIFLEAARELGVPRERAVVVEDAISGVQAGAAGGFGMVIGVDRNGDPERLREAGADIVVADLAEISLSP